MLNTPRIDFQQNNIPIKKEFIPNRLLLENPNFLMSPEKLHNIRMRKDSESRVFLEKLDNEIDKIVGENHLEIFNTIIEQGEEESENLQISTSDIEDAVKNIPLETKIIDLPSGLLGKILSYIPRESRSIIYIQRANISLEKLLTVIDHWSHNTVIGYHISPYEITDNKIKPDENGNVYYSNDIKHLYNNTNNGKYLYAFRLSKKTDEQQKYEGAPRYFKKAQGILYAEDSIKIADEKDPSYKTVIMEKLGASFEENYRGAGARAEIYLKNGDSSELAS